MTENKIAVSEPRELSPGEENRATIQLVLDGECEELKLNGDAFVGARIPALLTYMAAQMIRDQDEEQLLEVLAEYVDTPWTLVVTLTPASESGSEEDSWAVTRGEDEEDKKVLGPILVLLGYLAENEGVAQQIVGASLAAQEAGDEEVEAQ